ncbi:MAG TPA: SIS domain-containing protein [Phycisphaerae bacterium]|nr:SIS domain-containing protein [Phycisphaerae bacterium]
MNTHTVIRQIIADSQAAMNRLGDSAIAQIADAGAMVIDALRSGGAVLVCGNGGSAADAQHIAGELAGRYQRDRKAFNCLALTTNTSNLTAIANDFGYDRVFARQVEAHLRPGDVLWAISTSGNSTSIVEAANAAKDRGGKVLGFTGSSGGKLAALCDVCFKAPAEVTYQIQQLHQVAYHIICDLVERSLGSS